MTKFLDRYGCATPTVLGVGLEVRPNKMDGAVDLLAALGIECFSRTSSVSNETAVFTIGKNAPDLRLISPSVRVQSDARRYIYSVLSLEVQSIERFLLALRSWALSHDETYQFDFAGTHVAIIYMPGLLDFTIELVEILPRQPDENMQHFSKPAGMPRNKPQAEKDEEKPQDYVSDLSKIDPRELLD